MYAPHPQTHVSSFSDLLLTQEGWQLQTTWPKLSWPLASSWVWAMKGADMRLEWKERGWVCYSKHLSLQAWPWSVETALLTWAIAPAGSAVFLGFWFLWALVTPFLSLNPSGLQVAMPFFSRVCWFPYPCPYLWGRPFIKLSWVKFLWVCPLCPARPRVIEWPSPLILFPRNYSFLSLHCSLSSFLGWICMTPPCLQPAQLPYPHVTARWYPKSTLGMLLSHLSFCDPSLLFRPQPNSLPAYKALHGVASAGFSFHVLMVLPLMHSMLQLQGTTGLIPCPSSMLLLDQENSCTSND